MKKITCPKCNGTYEVDGKECTRCHGTGKVWVSDEESP